MGNFLANLFNFKKETSVVMIGLDSAGKTTILYKLKLGEVITTIPTIGFNVESVEYKNLNLTVWDVGGQNRIRPLWRHYYKNANAVIFVIDSNDYERFGEVKEELDKILAEEELREAPILIYANKCDLPNAKDPNFISKKLELNKIRYREYFIQQSNAATADGLYEGLDWLTKILNK